MLLTGIMNKILYVDGGCHGNGQPDLSKRQMIAVVTDDKGVVLIDKHQIGGSNNVSELLAVLEGIFWCYENKVEDVEIRTDSRNNFAWVRGGHISRKKKVSDRALINGLKDSVKSTKGVVNFKLVWVPRDDNLAGHFIEKTYTA